MNPVTDIVDCLLNFGHERGEAPKAYLPAIRLGRSALDEETGGDGEPRGIRYRPDLEPAPDDTGRYVDALGRSAGPERYQLSAKEFIRRCTSLLHVAVADFASGSRQHGKVEARLLIVTLARDRWGQSTKDLASPLDKSQDTETTFSAKAFGSD